MKISPVDKALAEACRSVGCCTKLDSSALIKKYGDNLNAKTFADSVLYAEGLDVKYSRHRKLLEQIFEKFCG